MIDRDLVRPFFSPKKWCPSDNSNGTLREVAALDALEAKLKRAQKK